MLPVVSDNVTWLEAGLLMAGLLAVGFLVSWVTTDLLKVRRPPYIAVLALGTVAASAAVMAGTGADLSDVAGHHWPAGLVGGAVAGLVAGSGLRKKEPATLHRHGPELEVAAAWEGIVYGVAEGLLLSVLPVFVLWQAAVGAGWDDAAAWSVGLGASIVMIAVHHFGYWDFRNRHVGLALIGCGLLSVAYLATGSLLAPVLGHVVLHLFGIIGGVELPPHVRPTGAGTLAGGAR